MQNVENSENRSIQLLNNSSLILKRNSIPQLVYQKKDKITSNNLYARNTIVAVQERDYIFLVWCIMDAVVVVSMYKQHECHHRNGFWNLHTNSLKSRQNSIPTSRFGFLSNSPCLETCSLTYHCALTKYKTPTSIVHTKNAEPIRKSMGIQQNLLNNCLLVVISILKWKWWMDIQLDMQTLFCTDIKSAFFLFF